MKSPKSYSERVAPRLAPLPTDFSDAGSSWIRDAKIADGKPLIFDVCEGFALALEAVAEVSAYGYCKHTKPARDKLMAQEGATLAQAEAAIPYNNWRNGNVRTYDNAMMRHILARAKGAVFASDSKMRHRAHEAWNALAALSLELLAEAKAVIPDDVFVPSERGIQLCERERSTVGAAKPATTLGFKSAIQQERDAATAESQHRLDRMAIEADVLAARIDALESELANSRSAVAAASHARAKAEQGRAEAIAASASANKECLYWRNKAAKRLLP